MKNERKWLIGGVLAGLGALVILAAPLFFVSHNTLGATVIQTNATDTFNTFRTNVNTSLVNLNAAISGSSFTSSTLNGLNSGYYTIASGNNLLATATTSPGTLTLTPTTTPVYTSVSSTQATHTMVTTTQIAITGLGTSGCLRLNGSTAVATTSCPGTFQFIIEQPVVDENDAIFIPRTTSTLDKVIVTQKYTTSNIAPTLTWNVGWASSTSRSAVTSSLYEAFSSAQVTVATTSPSVLIPNGSTTLPALAPLIFWTTGTASSTQFSMTAYYHEN